MTVSIVVPTLDEEAPVRALLPTIIGLADEVIVSDGGSTDGTRAVAKSMGARVVDSAAGRGPQLNRGAQQANSDIMLFLHADTRLPADAMDQVVQAIENGHVGGGFLVRFDDPRPIFRLGSQIVNLRTRLTRSPLGDQGQFCRRDLFLDLGGFQSWPILEDLDFIQRLGRSGSIAVVSSVVATSARRFVQGGIARTIANNWLIFGLYFLGFSPLRLARLYRPVR